MNEPTFTVDWGGLVTHALTVSRQADTVAKAQQAAGWVHLGPNAYGQLFQFIPGQFEPAQRALIEAAGKLHGATASLGENVKKAADDYEAADHGNRDAIKRIQINGG